MSKFLSALTLTALLAVALVPRMQAADWSQVVKQVEKSVVFVEVGDEGSCTGFVIDQKRHYVMTAAHCYKESMWADRVPAHVVSRDVKKDLLVIEVKDLDPSRPALHLAEHNPERGSEVMSVGYGYGLERPFFRQAHVQDDQLTLPSEGGPYISTDSTFVPGQSGGPVVNIAGEIVAIVQLGDNGSTGMGVGADIIRDRMGRFFGK